VEIIPAIDIINGSCVRLLKGDYKKKTTYSDDPVQVSSDWVSKGANRIHVVDLEGARLGRRIEMESVQNIIANVPVPVQLGGGIRSIDTVTQAIEQGVDRVMIGTAATNKDLIKQLCHNIDSERFLISVDVRDGEVVVDGWTKSSGKSSLDLIAELEAMGVKRIMYTDTNRDGTLTEPNYNAIETLVSLYGLKIIAAGGISKVDQLIRLSEYDIEGAVVGRALYTGDIELSYAIKAMQSK
jgi:phosphoribosylformimino-5-aminoimidazole carboxamide ribotide isomerase